MYHTIINNTTIFKLRIMVWVYLEEPGQGQLCQVVPEGPSDHPIVIAASSSQVDEGPSLREIVKRKDCLD